MMKRRILILTVLILKFEFSFGQETPKIFPGADEKTPSRSEYFSWINNRKYSPDLVLLNHRLNLGKGRAHSTTFLLGGAETYDLHPEIYITAYPTPFRKKILVLQ
jgi:hypothetical protein